MWAEQLLQWYEIHKRDLPWRDVARTPYQVLVSEIMLQQTQVPRVIEKYHEFLSLFAELEDLAKAPKADVIMAWKGLGYNRRAMLLHQFAQKVVEKYKGIIPQDPQLLLELPGIGSYTAGSVASFAFNLPVPAIDVNVRRIVMRIWRGVDQGLPMSRKEEEELSMYVRGIIPTNRSSDFHNALMDFGSMVCLRDKPLCESCVLRETCAFYPKYKMNPGKVLFVAERREEAGRREMGKHVPNRIFRGRIVNFVRSYGGNEVLVSTLGSTVKKDYCAADKEWLLELCARLEKEGYVKYEVTGERIRLSLA